MEKNATAPRLPGKNRSPVARFIAYIRKYWFLYMLVLPGFICMAVFNYAPMYGVVIAFKNYKNALGIMGSPWADPIFKNFQRFFNSYQCEATIRNTVLPSSMTCVSRENIDIIFGANRNSKLPEISIRQVSTKRIIRPRSLTLFLSLAPMAFPASVAAAVCMP